MAKIFVAYATNTILVFLHMQQTSNSTASGRTFPTSLSSKADPISPGLWHRVLATDAHFAPTIARVILGLAILPHGAQKLLGWYGGYGFTGTMDWFTGTMHLPWILGFAAIAAEVVGALALIVGAF